MRKVLILVFLMALVQLAFSTTLYLTTSGGSLGGEKWVSITTEANGAGTVIWAQGDGTYGNGAGYVADESFDVTDYETYYINCYDKYDDGWDGTTYEIRDAAAGGGNVVCNNGGASPNDGNDEDSNWEFGDPLLELESSESFSYPPAPKVFFSEYIEGSGSNKAVEIYNGTGSDVDLSDFAVVRYNNGSDTEENLFEFDTTLLAGDVYVIGNSQAAPEYSGEFDETSGLTWYNGDDFLGLIYDFNGDDTFDVATELIDAIGVLGVDPGTAWNVAGVNNATAEHTLLRKPNTTKGNTDWASSAGTDADDSEWIVMDQNYFDHLGIFPYLPIVLPFTENFDDVIVPDLPPLWESVVNSTSSSANVETYDSNYSSYSNPICLKLYNYNDSAAELLAISPQVPLDVNTLRIKFWSKVSTSGYSLEVGTYSTDERGFTLVESIELTSTYTEYEVNFSTYAGSDLNIAFRHGLGGTYKTIYIDDVVIEEIPTTPIFSVNPDEFDFEIVSINEQSVPQTFTIKNTGIGSIEIASGGITITGSNLGEFVLTDENTYPIELGENESADVEVAFAPTSVGNKVATLQIVDNLSRTINEVPLSGAVPYSPYDIQYTEEASGDSPFAGETVFVKGIVYAINWGSNQSYFIYDSTRPAEWNGLLVYDFGDNFPAIGDEVIVKGEVAEYNNMTELKNISSFTNTGGGNSLPVPEVVAAANVGQEMYEGVLVKIEDLEVTQTINSFGEFYVQNTGIPVECQIDDGFDGFDSTELNTEIGTEFYSIIGVVDYSFDLYGINPRNYFDVIQNVLELPYFNDFETDDGGLTHAGDNDSWEYGEPGEGSISGYNLPGTGAWGNVWGTDLDSLYMSSTLSYLYTPFVDLSDLTIGEDSGTSISYSHWYISESGWDGVNLKIFSLDSPQWVILDPVDGYDDDSIYGIDDVDNDEAGFCGTHEYWSNVKFIIPDEYLGSIVSFKFVFGSDSSGNRPGYYINDLKISKPVAELVLSTSDIDFGNLQVGQSGSETVTISNPAEAPVPLVITSISSSNPYFSMNQTRDFSINPGESMDFEVTFTPPSVGDFEGYFTISSNDPFTLPPYGLGVKIYVEGVGEEPYSILDTDNLPMNVNLFVDAGQTGSTQFDVTNLGVLPLDVDLSLPSRDFTVTPTHLEEIAYQSSETVTVDYTNSPLMNAVESSTLTLTTNEPMLPPGEQFAGWPESTPQNGWTIVDNNGVGDSWYFNNPGGIFVNTPTSGNGFAIFDSDAMSYGGGAEDCDLITPVLDFSEWTNINFNFYHYFSSSYGGGAELLISNDNGSSWSSVYTWPYSTSNAQSESFDLTTYAAGYSEVLVKFKWTGDWSLFWAIDDVTVTDGTRTRSLTEPSPRSYAVNLNSYITEPFDSLNVTSGYRAVNSVVPTGTRETDYPEYEWFNNMTEENLYVADQVVEFDQAFPYFGQDISSFSLSSYDNYGTHYPTPIIILNPEVVRKDVNLSDILRLDSKDRKNQINPNTNNLLSVNREVIDYDNIIFLSKWLSLSDSYYISSEDVGVVITVDQPSMGLTQIVLRDNGDISFNYKEIVLNGSLFTDITNVVGMRGLGEENQISYDQSDWVNANIRPEMTVRFYPEYSDTQLLPSTVTMLEDEVYEIDVTDYIASGGEVLDITMTDPENLGTVVEGNIIELHPELNYNNSTGVTVGYVITAMARGNKVRSIGEILVKIMPVNDLPEVVNPIASQELLEDFGTVNIDASDVFADPDNELNLDLSVSDPTKVTVELVGTEIILTSIENAFTYRVGETDTPVVVTVVANEILTRSNNGLAMSANSENRANTDLTFNISIEQVNDVPVVANHVANLDIDEDNVALIDLSHVFLDVDDDPMTYGYELEVGTHLAADLDPVTNILTLTPEADWNGSETIIITADDGVVTRSIGRTNKLTMNSSREMVQDDFILTVLPVNDTPIVVNPIDVLTMNEDGVDNTIDLNTVFGDVDIIYGDVLTFTESSNDFIDVAIAAGLVTLTPAPNWNGLVVVTFTATDDMGAFVEDVVTVTVLPVNDTPTIDLPAEFIFNEGGSLNRNFSQYVNDVDGDELTLSVSNNTFVTVDITGLSVNFGTETPLDFGEETLTFTIDDGVLSSSFNMGSRDTASDDVNIVVSYVNHAPEYSGPNYINLEEDFEPYTVGDLDTFFNDIDPLEFTNMTFEIINFNANKINAYIDPDNMLMIEAVENANGLSSLRIKASDNDSYSGRASLSTIRDIQVDITSVNDAPYFVDLPEVIEMAANSYTFINLQNNIIDVDDPTPVMEITTPEGFITATKLDGYDYRFRLSSLGVYGENDYITVIVDDGHDRTEVTAELYVTVAESEPPYVVYYIPNQEFDEDFVLTEIADLDDCFADPDNPTLNYAVEVLTMDAGNPVFEAEITEGENILYVGSAVANWNGYGQIRIDAWDVENRITVSQTVAINVLSVNDLPVATEIADVTLDEDFAPFTVVDLTTIFTDVDGDELVFDIGEDVTLDVVIPEIVGTELVLNSIPDVYGMTPITVRVHDESVFWIQTTFMVFVNDMFDAPTFNPGLAGMNLFISNEGQLINLENLFGVDYIDNHGQVNTVPIAFELIGDIPYYNVTVSEDYIFGLDIMPIGYQWGYPNQDLRLILESGEEVIVTLVTNLSPYILMEMPDMLIGSESPNYFDPALYFADPEGGTLYYNVIYDSTYLQISRFIHGTFLIRANVFDDIIDTDVTVVASDLDDRATVAQTFTVTILPSLVGGTLREVVHVESGEELRVNLNSAFNMSMDSALLMDQSVRTSTIAGNDLVISYETTVTVTECVDVAVVNNDGELEIQRYQVIVNPRSEDDTPVYVTALGENYPNPFNPETSIAFSLAEAGNVEINIYNARGQFVKTVQQGFMEAGNHQAIWNGQDVDGNNVASGIYFYRMKSDDNEEMRKMVLMK